MIGPKPSFTKCMLINDCLNRDYHNVMCQVYWVKLCIQLWCMLQLMILVDDAGGEWPVIGHAPWHGCHLADFVMPFFLFIVGMAIALALKVYIEPIFTYIFRFFSITLVFCFDILVQRIRSRIESVKKVILRTLKLLFWGILLQGQFPAYFHRYFSFLSRSLTDKLDFNVNLHSVKAVSRTPPIS